MSKLVWQKYQKIGAWGLQAIAFDDQNDVVFLDQIHKDMLAAHNERGSGNFSSHWGQFGLFEVLA